MTVEKKNDGEYLLKETKEKGYKSVLFKKRSDENLKLSQIDK